MSFFKKEIADYVSNFVEILQKCTVFTEFCDFPETPQKLSVSTNIPHQEIM